MDEVVERDEQAELAFDVKGMSCTSCVPRVERALSGAAGVTRAQVNYATGRAEVRVDSAAMSQPWARWLMLALAAPVQFVAGWPFLHGAALRARSRAASMDTLIVIGTLAAFGYSTVALIAGGDLFFDTAALIFAFLCLGRYFEARAKGNTSGAIRKLLEFGARDARLLVDGSNGMGTDQP